MEPIAPIQLFPPLLSTEAPLDGAIHDHGTDLATDTAQVLTDNREFDFDSGQDISLNLITTPESSVTGLKPYQTLSSHAYPVLLATLQGHNTMSLLLPANGLLAPKPSHLLG